MTHINFASSSVFHADLYQIALLIDQLRHEDPALRVAAASRLEDIGGERYGAQYNAFPSDLIIYVYIYVLLLNSQSVGPREDER